MRVSVINAVNATLFDVIGDNSDSFELYSNNSDLSPSKFKRFLAEGIFPDSYDVIGKCSNKLIKRIYEHINNCIINGYDYVLIDRNIVDNILENKAITRYRKFIQTHCDSKKQEAFLKHFKNSDKTLLYNIPIATDGVKINHQGVNISNKTYHNAKLVQTSIIYLLKVYLKMLYNIDKTKCENFCSKININELRTDAIVNTSINRHNHCFMDIEGDILSHFSLFNDNTCFQIDKYLKHHDKIILSESDENIKQISLNILISKLIISGITNIKSNDHTHISCNIKSFIDILNEIYDNIITFEHFKKLIYNIVLTLSRIYVKISYSILKYEWCKLNNHHNELKQKLISNNEFGKSKKLLMKLSISSEVNVTDSLAWESDILYKLQDTIINEELFNYLGLNPTKLEILLDYGLNKIYRQFKNLIQKQLELKKCSTSLCNLIAFNNEILR